jgi:hypothetical protein
MEEKKKIPSPDKYECNVHRKNFNDLNKKSQIYMFDRKSVMGVVIEEAKKTPGIGKYETLAFDEKRCKPPKGTYTIKTRKTSVIEEVMEISKDTPFAYEAVNLTKIKNRPYS